MIEIILNHTPVSWAASKVCGKIHYDPKSKEKIRARRDIKSKYGWELDPIKGFVHLDFTFQFSIPKSTTLKKRKDMLNGILFPTRLDTTNMQKFYEDCIKNIVIEDDRFVASVTSRKQYSLNDKIVIKVFPLSGYNTKREHENNT